MYAQKKTHRFIKDLKDVKFTSQLIFATEKAYYTKTNKYTGAKKKKKKNIIFPGERKEFYFQNYHIIIYKYPVFNKKSHGMQRNCKDGPFKGKK